LSTFSTNTLGKYQIIREIGRSNDIVYEAIDPTINRRIALKELAVPPGVQGAQRRERIERFWREGKAAGKLSHPNIVTIYEVGKENERYFIAMEFLEGQTLRDVLQQGGPLPIKDAVSYTTQLCSALAYAHQNGVIHRDVKPENVQVLPGGHVKLTDFGIARLMGEAPITQDGQVFVTPSYMSPEQVAGKNLDARSDIFSLGVLLYEMVAGSKPFSGDSIVTVTYNIMNMEPPPPPGAPPWISGIIRKAMAKEPDARYSTADEMAEDLRNETCSGQFMGPANGYGAYPSPFGGASQGPYQSPPGAYQPPQQAPYGPPPQGPFGQPSQGPWGQPSQGPMTPYGTPMPSPGAGSIPPAPGTPSAPDPFAQPMPQSPMPPSPPPGPPQPIMSSETRNFLGVFILIVGFAGMLIFAIWAVNLSYTSYQIKVGGEHAQRYLKQGNKLYAAGNTDGAIEQWRSAIRVAPESAAGKTARDCIFQVLVNKSYTIASQNGSAYELLDNAQELIKMKPNSPEGHYYAGYAYEGQGDPKTALSEYELAIQYGGNDQYAISARSRRDAISAAQGSSAAPSTPSSPDSSSNTAPAPAPPQNNSPIPYEQAK